jgi:hypothetical protein
MGEDPNEEYRGDRRHRNVHHVVSDQDRGQQFVIFLCQVQDLLRLVVSVAGLCLEFDPVDRCERRFCCRKIC